MKGLRFDERKKAKYLGCLARGMRRGAAARAAGIDRRTVQYHAADDPEFARACQDAEEMACDPVEDALWQAAVEGNVTAMKLWLYNRSPDRWRDRTVFPAPAPAQDAAPETPDEIKKKLAQLLEDGGSKPAATGAGQ